MRIHFFSRADVSGRSAFRIHYVFQNLRTVKTTSTVFFVFCVLVRIIFLTYNLSNQTIHHLNDYNAANWLALLLNPLFYCASIYFTKHFKENRRFIRFSQILVFTFALYIIICGMRASFFIMHNPRNAMVMYLIGLIIAGMFFTFEYYETILITLITGLIFIVMLPFYQQRFDELVLNNLASLLLLTSFYCICRFLFSYRADNFYKLQAIEQKNIEIEYASQAKNEILGVVAHDLRNPLAIIQSITAFMEMDGGVAEDYQENLKMIRASCDKASSIINDLLETAQNEIITELDLEKTELDNFLTETIAEWLKNRKGYININYNNTGKPEYALINKEKMQRVMDNLISNALKFSGRNDYIDISLHDTDDSIFIDVKDFGIGIPPNLLPYIFDRFSKARRNGVNGEASVGLGLSIVHQIIKKHNGEITVSSAAETGTTFSIKLPKAS